MAEDLATAADADADAATIIAATTTLAAATTRAIAIGRKTSNLGAHLGNTYECRSVSVIIPGHVGGASIPQIPTVGLWHS